MSGKHSGQLTGRSQLGITAGALRGGLSTEHRQAYDFGGPAYHPSPRLDSDPPGIPDQILSTLGEQPPCTCSRSLIALWGASVIGFIAVMIYRATLTQHETDQLFLSDDSSHMSMEHREHDEIVARVDKLRPYYQGLGGAAVLMTVLVVGVYIIQILPSLKF